MSAFYDNNITDKGRLLMADIQMGAKFKPTRIVIGSGYLPTGVTTKTITGVVSVVKSLELNKGQKLPTGEAVFGAAFDNKDITEPFYYRELGLYAKGVYDDGTETAEVLYSYGNAGANAELIPAYSTSSVVERQLDLITYIGNDTAVSLTISSGVFVDFPTFNAAVGALEDADENIKARLLIAENELSKKIDENKVQELIQPINKDIQILDGKIKEVDGRVDDLETRADLTDSEIAQLKADDLRIEGKTNENAAKVSALWDALLTDVTANPTLIDFDDLTGFTLTGGVWNKPLRRLEV